MPNDFIKDIGHSSFLEKKISDMERPLVIRKENGIKILPIFRDISAFIRGILKKTDFLTVKSSNIELLFHTITSTNQLSISAAVSNWSADLAEKIHDQTSLEVDNSFSRVNDQLSEKLDPQEVNSLVQNPTRTETVAGNSLHDHLWRCQILDPEDQVRKIWESAGFMRRITVGIRYRTIEDVNDVFENRTGSCRNYTLPPDDLDFEIKLWIKENTDFGSFLEVHTICLFDVNGIAILIPPRLETIQFLGGNIPRSKPSRWRVTIQWSRLFSRKLRRSWSWDHWGNSCRTVDWLNEISVQSIRRSRSFPQKEMDWHQIQ